MGCLVPGSEEAGSGGDEVCGEEVGKNHAGPVCTAVFCSSWAPSRAEHRVVSQGYEGDQGFGLLHFVWNFPQSNPSGLNCILSP